MRCATSIVLIFFLLKERLNDAASEVPVDGVFQEDPPWAHRSEERRRYEEERKEYQKARRSDARRLFANDRFVTDAEMDALDAATTVPAPHPDDLIERMMVAARTAADSPPFVCAVCGTAPVGFGDVLDHNADDSTAARSTPSDPNKHVHVMGHTYNPSVRVPDFFWEAVNRSQLRVPLSNEALRSTYDVRGLFPNAVRCDAVPN